MRFIVSRRHKAMSGLVMVAALGTVGCASPPSVVPLLTMAKKQMQNEAAQVAAATKRDQAEITRSQAALKAGFDADLASQSKLTAAWVKEETAGYVAARAALVEQSDKLKQEQTQRIDNLNAAASAQQRAIELLQRQDALIGKLWPQQWSTLRSVIGGNQSSQGSQP